ncbi:hypothetical protein Cgig2_023672 [Carnegiea gigantea]|uniref:Uncharacterized protein n=1 Tax=Carnegiea gigantea TaxID=171969 RepID=A0A9Q1KKP9_9CARY|nr:hypothetical protein Cgig2_023672 [Carnegiea gigantea]
MLRIRRTATIEVFGDLLPARPSMVSSLSTPAYYPSTSRLSTCYTLPVVLWRVSPSAVKSQMSLNSRLWGGRYLRDLHREGVNVRVEDKPEAPHLLPNFRAATINHSCVVANQDLAMVLLFGLGYAGIILEKSLAFNKSGVGLLMAVSLWVIRSIGVRLLQMI